MFFFTSENLNGGFLNLEIVMKFYQGCWNQEGLNYHFLKIYDS